MCVCDIHKDLKDKHQEPATNLFFVPIVIKKQNVCVPEKVNASSQDFLCQSECVQNKMTSTIPMIQWRAIQVTCLGMPEYLCS